MLDFLNDYRGTSIICNDQIFSYIELNLRIKFYKDLLNKYTNIIPLRGEKKYQHFLEFKLLKEPFFNKEFNANDLLDYLLTFIVLRKILQKL